jgi:hypothetical protein
VKLPRHKRKRAHEGTVSLTATCDQNATADLTGTITELLSGKSSHGKPHTQTFALRGLKTSLQANQPATLIVELPKMALAGLKAHKHESISFTLHATNTNGTSVSTARTTHLKALR